MDNYNRIFVRIFTAVALLTSYTVFANTYSKEEEAYRTCLHHIAKEVGKKRFSTFEKTYAKAKHSKQLYRFYINSTYADPELEAIREYRAVCEAKGYATLKSISIRAGHWKYPQGRSGFLQIEEENWLAQQ